MKKLSFYTVLVIAMYVVLPVLAIIMTRNIDTSDFFTKMRSEGFGYYQDTIYVGDGSYKASVVEAVSNQNVATAVYSDESFDDDTVLRQIFFNDNYIEMPMKSGSFFKPGDFAASVNTAVIGKNLEGRIVKENGKKYIDYAGIRWEVKGVYGFEETTFFDNYIFVNMMSDYIGGNATFTIDYLSKQRDYEQISDNIIDGLSKRGIEAKHMSTGEGSYFSSFVPTVNSSVWFIFLIICCVLCILATSFQWLASKKKEMAVKLMIGASKKRVIKEYSVKYALMTLIAVVAFVVFSLLTNSIYIKAFTVGCIILALLITFFTMVIKTSVKRLNIVEERI